MKIYLLSNASRCQPEYYVNILGNEYFDDIFVSVFYLCRKSAPEIYTRVAHKFGTMV